MEFEDHYSLLGLTRDATIAAIKREYLALARRHHPDAGGDHGRMTGLNRAWATLRDQRQRERYDLTLPGRRTQSIEHHHRTVEKVIRRAAERSLDAGKIAPAAARGLPLDGTDWFALLGVWPGADAARIREAYSTRLAELEFAGLDADAFRAQKQGLDDARSGLLDPATRRAFNAMRARWNATE